MKTLYITLPRKSCTDEILRRPISMTYYRLRTNCSTSTTTEKKISEFRADIIFSAREIKFSTIEICVDNGSFSLVQKDPCRRIQRKGKFGTEARNSTKEPRTFGRMEGKKERRTSVLSQTAVTYLFCLRGRVVAQKIRK